MIYIVIGGSLSGKTTYVRDRFLVSLRECDEHRTGNGVPYTQRGSTFVVGHYLKQTRTCGVDQMGRDYSKIHALLTRMIKIWDEDLTLVMEGNAVADSKFLHSLKGYKVHLILKIASVYAIRERARLNNIKYGSSILTLSYRRAAKAYAGAPKEFIREIIFS